MTVRPVPAGLVLALAAASFLGCSEGTTPTDAPTADAAEDRATPPADIVTPPVDSGPVRCTGAAECDDGIACTDDSCGMDGVCAHTGVNDRCSDGRFCNGPEVCEVGRGCVGGAAPACDDMNANTTDRCDNAANACRNDPLDNDGDGDPALSAGGRDCDDNDRTRSSLEREICNGRDDNCNAMTDEGALNSCGTCDPTCRGVSTGGMGGMAFNPAGQRGVELDPMAGGLLVRAQARMGDYLWIPNVNESSLSKWDASVTPPVELGRYRVGLAANACLNQCCHLAGCNMPSRTVVDGFGDAYVANRGFGIQGTITKIAADRRDCVDRNGNGMIDTSTGPADVRPYGQDECVLWTSNVGPVDATLRALAIDRGDPMAPQGYPWVGSCPNPGTNPGQSAWKLDPRTGAVLRTVPMPWGCSYGAVGLADGSVWFHRYGGYGGGLVRLDTTTNTTTGPFSNTAATRCQQTYGVTADANGRLWMSGIGCNAVVGYDPASNQWTEANIGTTTGLGITVDPMNNIWTQTYPSGSTLIRFPASAFTAGGTIPAGMITRINRPGAALGQSSAIGADRLGNIWFTHADAATRLFRYTASAPSPAFTDYGGPNRVYTYTDFTGSVRRTVIGTGLYTEDYDTMCADPTVAELRWDAVTPAGTTLNFSIQSADTAMGLGGARIVPVSTAPRDTSPVNVAPLLRTAMVTARRHLRVTVTFNTSTMPVASPVLRGMSLTWRCPYTIPNP